MANAPEAQTPAQPHNTIRNNLTATASNTPNRTTLSNRLIDNDTVRVLLLQQWDGEEISDAELRQALDCCGRVGMFLRDQWRDIRNEHQGGVL